MPTSYKMADLAFLDDPEFGLPSYFEPKAPVLELDPLTDIEPSSLLQDLEQTPELKKLTKFKKGTTTLGFVF